MLAPPPNRFSSGGLGAGVATGASLATLAPPPNRFTRGGLGFGTAKGGGGFVLAPPSTTKGADGGDWEATGAESGACTAPLSPGALAGEVNCSISSSTVVLLAGGMAMAGTELLRSSQ